MGASAPSAPKYQVPAGQPSFIPTNAGFNGPNATINSYFPGQSALDALAGTSIGGDWNSVQGQTIQAQQAGYNMSDAAFAAQYPGMVNARNQYQTGIQNLLGTQTPYSMAQGNALSNASESLLPQGQTAINAGQNYANQAQGFYNQGQGLYSQGNPIYNSGQFVSDQGKSIIAQGDNMYGQAQSMYQPAGQLAAQSTTAGSQDMALGQKLINGDQALDPMVQQELMRSGLQGAASSLGGAAALGGTAGQAAVGRNLGVGAENWINQQRTMGQGLQTTGAQQDATLAGAASNLAGAGSGMVNADSGVIGAGAGVVGAGTGLYNASAGMYNAGSTAANAGSGMASAGAGLMGAGSNIFNTGVGGMTAGQGILNNATSNANQTMAIASGLFQPRTFGLAGSDASNIALSNVAGVNNMNQFDYQTKVAAAAQNAQVGAANAGAAAQASAQNTQAAVGTGTAVATTAATVAAMSAMSCWVARAVMPLGPNWLSFRSWMLLKSPKWFRYLYLRHGQRFAGFIDDKPTIKFLLKRWMLFILARDEQQSGGFNRRS